MADIKSLLFIVLLLIFCVPFTICQEVDDEREFSYDVKSRNGPARWGEIHPEWSMCNKGEMQSPVDLTHKRVQTTSELGTLDTDYKPNNTTLVNRGHDMMLRWIGGAGHIRINGTEYHLNQAHWHTPSEHTINGRRFNVELHLLHQSIDEEVAVVGILYRIGRPDSFLEMLEPYLKALGSTREVEASTGMIDPRDIKIGSREYYRYIGSLTTPPCDQDVIWTIVREVRTISLKQMRIIREAVHDEAEANARPIQALNDRWLKLYRPDDKDERIS